MSSTIISVAELIRRLGQSGANADDRVVVWSPFEVDRSEGEVDGPIEPQIVWGHEVRTGWNLIRPGEDCSMCGCPAEDGDFHARLVLLCDTTVDDLLFDPK